jgi:phosphate starvation-inducible PhoH-like protein
MKMFLTRIGEGCRIVVNGDLRQKDIPGESGLADAVRRLSAMDGVGLVEFTREDIVRSGIVRRIVEAYDDA